MSRWLPEPDTPRDRLWLWRAGFGIVRWLAVTLAPMRIEGLEHIPRGGFILVANHISWMDPPWIEFGLRTAVRYMTKHEVFQVPLLGWLLRNIGCFPIRRGASDRRALLAALRVLEAGLPLGFFPEGHRSESGALIRAHPGISLVARRSNAPILPVAIVGSDRARLGRLWRRDIRVRVGEPFYARDLAAGDDQAMADAIMARIAAMLPAEMRGVYA